MKNQYSIFKKFPNLKQAEELQVLLNSNNIETIIADNKPSVDLSFSGNNLLTEIEIRIKQSDFKKAESIVEKSMENIINEIDKDHYLFQFSNHELYDLLSKPDEWCSFDYVLAQKILNQRGEEIDNKLLESLKNKRIEILSKPEENQKNWIIAGYFFSFLGGYLGLLIGYFIWKLKKTLPNGQKIHSHSNNDRKHGKYIFYIGLIIASLTTILKVISLI